MCCYLIWLPSPLPHNPRWHEGDINFTASSFCRSIAFCFGGPDRTGVRPSRCLDECPEMLCFIPTGNRTFVLWWDGRQLHNAEDQLLFFLNSHPVAAEFFFSSLLCSCRKRKWDSRNLWLMSFAAIWCGGAFHFLLSVFAFSSSVVQQAVFISYLCSRNLCSGLMVLMLKFDSGLLPVALKAIHVFCVKEYDVAIQSIKRVAIDLAVLTYGMRAYWFLNFTVAHFKQ